MRKVFLLIAVVTGILILSALITPMVHAVLNPWFRFEKIFNRIVMVFMVLAAVLYVLKRRSREGVFLEPRAWREYGFDFSVPWRKLFRYGFLMGLVTVLSLAVLEVAFGPRYLRQPVLVPDVSQRFIKGMLSGFAVGIVEEFFFRGFIFVHLKRRMDLLAALISTSAFYSIAHFFDNGMIFVPPHPTTGDAFRLLFGYLEPMVHRPLSILPEFTGLFLFGLLLGLAVIRTGSLFLAIGIHAGSVFLIKFQYSFVREGPGLYHPFFGNSPYYDGPVEWFILALLGFVIWKFVRHS